MKNTNNDFQNLLNSEIFFNIKFPSSYVDCIKKSLELKKNFLIYFDIAWSAYERVELCGLISHEMDELLDLSNFVLINKNLINYQDTFQNVIAFSLNPFGDYVCFDYRNGWDNLDPPVVYWNHEAPENENISPIAKNFDEFLSMLMNEEEAEKELERLRNEPKQE